MPGPRAPQSPRRARVEALGEERVSQLGEEREPVPRPEPPARARVPRRKSEESLMEAPPRELEPERNARAAFQPV